MAHKIAVAEELSEFGQQVFAFGLPNGRTLRMEFCAHLIDPGGDACSAVVSLFDEHGERIDLLVNNSGDERKSMSAPCLAQLRARFVCPSFDLQAAAIAANLWAEHKKLPKDQRYKDRHVLRADSMIIAAAKSLGATRFYSHDEDCRKLAQLIMVAEDLPVRDPNDMFAVEEIRSGRLKVEELLAPRKPKKKRPPQTST